MNRRWCWRGASQTRPPCGETGRKAWRTCAGARCAGFPPPTPTNYGRVSTTNWAETVPSPARPGGHREEQAQVTTRDRATFDDEDVGDGLAGHRPYGDESDHGMVDVFDEDPDGPDGGGPDGGGPDGGGPDGGESANRGARASRRLPPPASGDRRCMVLACTAEDTTVVDLETGAVLRSEEHTSE